MLDVRGVPSDDPKSSVHESGAIAHVQVLEVEGSRRGRRHPAEGSCGRTRFAGLAVDGRHLEAAWNLRNPRLRPAEHGVVVSCIVS